MPRGYTGRTRRPVVFNFHGFGSGAVQQMVYGDFKPLAERDDFLIVAPDGQGTTGRHFNFIGAPGQQNDVQMVGALLDHIEATLCVDTQRVFAAGMSERWRDDNGARVPEQTVRGVRPGHGERSTARRAKEPGPSRSCCSRAPPTPSCRSKAER